jgi:hypothetical protein
VAGWKALRAHPDDRPRKFAEIYDSLDAGQTVKWAFGADRVLSFNVHYHVDKDVRYPAKLSVTLMRQ